MEMFLLTALMNCTVLIIITTDPQHQEVFMLDLLLALTLA